MRLSIPVAAILAVVLTGWAAGSATAREFAPQDMARWSTRSFEGNTEYRVSTGNGRAALRATAQGTASARYREVDVDLDETPYLVWSWRADEFPGGASSERSKDGDDFAVRVYVVREGFFGRLSAQALNYIWAREEPVGALWPNPFAGRARMLAVASGDARSGSWLTHRRDLRADWQRAFGTELDALDGVAIMTDADNTGGRARGAYGTIRFCAEPDCRGSSPSR